MICLEFEVMFYDPSPMLQLSKQKTRGNEKKKDTKQVEKGREKVKK